MNGEHGDSDEVTFITRAFGIRACCTLNSWTLVLAFIKMVYCCFLLGITTFAISLVFLGGLNDFRWHSTLILTVVPYFIFATIFATISSRVFISVAVHQGDEEKLSSLLLHFVIYKFISAMVTFIPLLCHFGARLTPGLETLLNSFAAFDTTFAILYILILYNYIRNCQGRETSPQVIIINEETDGSKAEEKFAMV